MSVLDRLNSAQQEAVRTIDGPLLILAGPGSGKTRVIVHRVAYLMEQGVHPANILAVTFTNRAAREMRERLESLVGPHAQLLTVGTFHATCARWLRRDGHHLGIERDFTIFDDHDQVDLVKRIMRELALDEKRFNPRSFLSAISAAKSELTDHLQYAAQAEGPRQQQVAQIYGRYQQLLAESRALDFDDLIGKVVVLFRQTPDVLARYQDRYRYLMVDEFQDTNVAQYQLVRLLGSRDRNVAVVGDPDQSIYGWRRADVRNIFNFESDFPELKVVTLEQNYRSTQIILDAAQGVIAANQLRKPKRLWTENSAGSRIVLHEAFDERDEAAFVVREASRLVHHGDARLRDQAVLYRTNAQSRALEDALVRAGIPYRLVGGTRFYERKEIKDILAYLRVIHNPYDSVSLERVINLPPRGIGAKTVADLVAWSRQLGVPVYAALQRLGGLLPEAAAGLPAPFSARARNGLVQFLTLIEGLREAPNALDLADLVDALLDRTGYAVFVRDGSDEGEDRWSNILELRAKAVDYEGMDPDAALSAFLEEVALVQDVDSLDMEQDAITLITLHQAKGLEFPIVFITGLEDGLCPHVRSMDDPTQMEEERRLLYVGITRAMQRLYLVHAFRRGFYGTSSASTPSRFLADIPAEVLEASFGGGSSFVAARPAQPWQAAVAAPARPLTASRPARRARELDELDEAPARRAVTEQRFQAGDRVLHPTFGDGVVVASRMTGDDEQVEVLFRGNVTKKLSMAFAPLERV